MRGTLAMQCRVCPGVRWVAELTAVVTTWRGLQGTKWRRLITFEKSNPLLLNDESKRERVRFVFQQCLDCLRFYPEIW